MLKTKTTRLGCDRPHLAKPFSFSFLTSPSNDLIWKLTKTKHVLPFSKQTNYLSRLDKSFFWLLSPPSSFPCACPCVCLCCHLCASSFPAPCLCVFCPNSPCKIFTKKGELNSGKLNFISSRGGLGAELPVLCTNLTPTCRHVHLAYPLPCFDFSRSLSFLWSLCLCSFSLYLSLCLWESERENDTLDSTVKTYSRVAMCWDVRICYTARAKSKMTKAGSTLKWRGQTINTPTIESSETSQPASWSVKIHPRCRLAQSRNHIS